MSTNLWVSVPNGVHVIPDHQVLVKGLWSNDSIFIDQPDTSNLLIWRSNKKAVKLNEGRFLKALQSKLCYQLE